MRLLRPAGSLLVVTFVYWLYTLVVVPCVEPAAVRARAAGPSEAERELAQQRLSRQVSELEGLFPPGSWELQNPKILESDQVKLLLRDYANLGDGGVEIRPCTLILLPKDAADDAERKRRSVVLQAPEGARLEFDEPFDLRRVKIGRLTSGRLVGQITIRSGGRSAGSEDDLSIVTRNVELNSSRVWTPHAVDFRYGPNYGHGEQLQIKLLPGDETAGSGHGPNIGGMESFEVTRLESLHLEPGSIKAADASLQGFAPGDGRAMGPVEISCRGPFRFDPAQQLASFENHVDVFLLNADGSSDQITSERLSIFFARPRPVGPAGIPADGKPASPFDLHPRRVEAWGRPVVVHSPARDAQARGQRLEFDLETRQITLEGGADQEAFLRQADNEIHAQKVEYQLAAAGRRIGCLVGKGPGSLVAGGPAAGGQRLEARWNGLLRLRPDQDQHAISLSGGVELGLGAMGRLTAAEIHLWFSELPEEVAAVAGQPPFRPERMFATGGVSLDAAAMRGKVEQMKLWFEPVAVSPVPLESPAPAGPQPASQAMPVPPDNPAPVAPTSSFALDGKLLQARMAVAGTKTSLLELIIDGDVHLLETATASPDEQPLAIDGDRIHIRNADMPHAEVTVAGEPANFAARGLRLSGSNINLNRGTNRLWIDGPGRMNLPLDRDFQGQPIADPVPLVVHWQQKMEFDGRTVTFQDAVVAESREQNLKTQLLEISLKQAVRFDQAADLDGRPPEIEQIACRGGAQLENRTMVNGSYTSNDRMEVVDLTINMLSGDSIAHGPGWFTTVRRGALNLAQQMGAGGQQANTVNSSQLAYLNVSFQESLTGNLFRRSLSFQQQVRTIYGPVSDWNETLNRNKPEALGTSGLLLDCNRLTVNESPLSTREQPATELTAEGNVVVEGASYYARGARMSYDQLKGLLVLEGDGRSEAELYHQKHVGGPAPKATAGQILFWPSTGRLQVHDARSVEISRLPGR